MNLHKAILFLRGAKGNAKLHFLLDLLNAKLHNSFVLMKTKGQQNQVAKLELLALCLFRGGLAERSNAAGLQPDNAACPTVHGFESLTRRQIDYTRQKR
jgi:hypothetical protein